MKITAAQDNTIHTMVLFEVLICRESIVFVTSKIIASPVVKV